MKHLVDQWNGHLEENDMTYCQHFRFAMCGAVNIVYQGIRLAIHSITPCFHRSALMDVQSYVAEKRATAIWNKVSDRQRLQPSENNNEYTDNRVSTSDASENS